MTRRPDAEGFLSLWPTLLLQRRLPGHEAPNALLIELIHKLERERPDLTTDYLGDNLLASEHPAVRWLAECINRTAVDYLKHCGLDYRLSWQLMGWANINRLGDYHDPHNHPHSYLSGTYYLAVPTAAEAEALPGRSDRRPGAITFYDPRPQANMTAIKGDPQVEAEYTVEPEAGLLLLWPSFLTHFVHPNLSRRPRISLSYNIVLKWRDAYLPAQR